LKRLYSEECYSMQPHATIPKSPEEDEFWVSHGQSLINKTLDNLDDRAKFMITTCASLMVADFAILSLTSLNSIISISPQFFFSISALCFMISLFPQKYVINAWVPDQTKEAYKSVTKKKYKYHKFGFALFFIALLLVAFTSFSIAVTLHPFSLI
jgi:hypothetical protein